MSLYDSILITGGGGMLGHALDDQLRARGHHPNTVRRGELDIVDEGALAHAFALVQPTLVLNCAAHTKVDLCEEEPEKADAINGYAVGHIAALCARHGAFMVHVSTDFVFDGTIGRPHRPDDAVNPMQAYGRSKLLGEKELRRRGSRDWLIVRTAWVYGRHGANFPRTMVNAARAGKPLAVVADQIGTPTYAPDLALAILDLLDANQRGVFHVTNAGQTTWLEFARETLKEFNLPREIKPLTSQDWLKIKPNSAARPHYTVLDTGSFTQAVGRPMRPWQEPIKDFRAAVDAHGF
jgi:dTDP-4-dehydrorhamnose reductase